MRKLNHQFEAQVWYDPEVKRPPLESFVYVVFEDYRHEEFLSIEKAYVNLIEHEDGSESWSFVNWNSRRHFADSWHALAWTAWDPEYLFEPVDVHAPIRGIVKESIRGGKNVWN